MTDFTIFGTGAPSGVVAQSDTSELALSTAFYVLGVTGWRAKGIRFWVPAGMTVPASGQKGFLWIGTSNTPDSILATADFSGVAAGQWNTVFFSAPVSLIAGRFYFAQVYLPVGGYGAEPAKFSSLDPIQSVDTTSLYAAGPLEVTCGQGSFVTGASGQPPSSNFNYTWYGVDVLVDDGTGTGGPGAADAVGIADEVTTVRSGLPTAIHAAASATDTLGLASYDSKTFPVGGATAFHTVRRALFDTRIAWGSVENASVNGPGFATDAAGSLTLGLEFHVQWPVRLVGCRIYKAPNLAGSIAVRLWDLQGAGGAPRELALTTVNWVVDAGGWREVLFSAPVDLDANVDYTVSYYSPNSAYAVSTWVFAVFSDVVTPMVVKAYQELAAGTIRTGGSAYRLGSAQQIPNVHTAHNYYIEPIVEWDSVEPVFKPDPLQSYYDQFVNGRPNHKFMISVFFSDVEFIQEYADMGINAIVAGYANPSYIAVIKAAGIDHYPFYTPPEDPDRTVVRAVSEDPEYAALVKGYNVIDEPDLGLPYRSPSTVRTWYSEIRALDSTRPLMLGLSKVVGINQTYYHQPQGSNMDEANKLWREWAVLPDILYGDFYAMAPDFDPDARWGVWIYPAFTRRLRDLNEGRTPVYVAVETTSETADYPVPDNVRKAIWSCIIEGCNGIILFDHRFGNNTVERDFAHMLHNPPMKAMMTALIVQINALVDAINSPDLGLVTAVTSSNTTAGPYGGTYGVPMHYTTREDADYEYLFAMGIRPGSTSATFTIPSWAGETLEVIDEGRTVTVDGSGVLTDDFPADYTVHLYRRTP